MPRNRELMRVFRDMELVEQIGSGMSRILKTYDRSIFELTPGFTVVTFHFNKALILPNEKINEAINLHFEAINEAIKKELKQLLLLISNNPMVKRSILEQMMEKSNATVERYLKMLKEKELIEYIGSNKTGGYKIKG